MMKKLLLFGLVSFFSLGVTYSMDCGTNGAVPYNSGCGSGTPPANDQIANAEVITGCNLAFTFNNICATAQNGLGNDDSDGCYRNIDGQSSGCAAGVSDVSWSVEADMFWLFCPATTNTWTIDMGTANCVNSAGGTSVTGMQIAIYEVPSPPTGNLSGCTQVHAVSGTTSSSLDVTPPNTTSCYYINVDGFAGDACDVSMEISTAGSCTVAPVSNSGTLKVQGKKSSAGENLIRWESINGLEENTESFILERSYDLNSWEEIAEVSAYSQSSVYYYTDAMILQNKDASYYKIYTKADGRLVAESGMIAINNKRKNGGVKSTRIFDINGKEFSEDKLPSGVVIYITEFEDGSVETKKAYNK